MELQFLRSEVPELRQALGISNASPSGQNSTASDNRDEKSQSSSEEEEFVDDLPVQTLVNKASRPRMSVSAEVFGKFNVQKEYVPPVYQKTPE